MEFFVHFLSHYITSILWAVGLSSFVFLLTSYRTRLVYNLFHIPLSYRQALVAQSATVLGNMFWIPIVGGLIAQKKVLHNMPPAVMASIHLCERVLVAVVGMFCALGAAWFIWGHSWVDEAKFTSDLFHISVAMVSIGLYVFRSSISLFWREISIGKMIGIFVLAAFIWLMSSLVFACFFYPDYALKAIVPHSLVVSFISSLPITWNGWGVREAASVYVFQNMGVSTSTALAVAVSCGVISIIVALGMGLKWGRQRMNWQVSSAVPTLFQEGRFLIAMGLACAFLIFFQIYIPGGSFKLNINAGDPLAMGGLFLYGLHLFQNRKEASSWGPILFIALTMILLMFSAFWGVMQFGGSWWGCLNKAMGLAVVWGYFGLGMMFSHYQTDLQPILEIMKKVIVCIIIYHFVCLAVTHNFYSGNFLCVDMKGFAMNRNAFAMQVMCVLLALMCCSKSYKSLIVMNVALYFTFSRTALILTPLIYAFAWGVGVINRQQIFRIWALSGTWVVGLNLVDPLFFFTTDFLKTYLHEFNNIVPTILPNIFPTMYSGIYSDTERWYTIVQGFQMWKDNLWLGAGLGAFVQNEWLQHQRYLMIHNSYIWILAEMGIVGGIAWGSFAGWISYASLKLKGDRRFAAVGICSVMLITAMVHEVIYQRVFWWMLGLLLGAQPACLALPQQVTKWIQRKLKMEPSAHLLDA